MKIKTIHFEKHEGSSLYKQVYEAIKEDILNGYMHYGDQLPSIRECAKQVSLSRTSIEAAYQRLLLEGYISAKAQRGYFVDVDEKSADLRKSILRENKTKVSAQKVYDLRSSSIDITSFDRSVWMHYVKDILQDEELIMSYGDSQGEKELRVALQKYSYASRGVLAEVSQILVGASFQYLLYLCCSLYEGKKVVGMEVGGFAQAEQVFQDFDFSIKMLACDEEGITMDALKQQDIGILYINSASCGTKRKALRSHRRNEILTWAKTNHVLILEDDHNGELRYHSKIRPAMQGFDMGEQVVYIRSFSKLLMPSLRLSFMVLNEQLSKQYRKQKQRYNPSASKMEQLVLAHYIRDGHMDRQIRRLRKRYELKSKIMMEALTLSFPEVHVVLDESALQIGLHFPKEINTEDFMDRARQHQILLQASSGHISLSFASIEADEIEDVIAILAKIWYEISYNRKYL